MIGYAQKMWINREKSYGEQYVGFKQKDVQGTVMLKKMIVENIEEYGTIKEAVRLSCLTRRTINRWLEEAGKSWRGISSPYTERDAKEKLAKLYKYDTFRQACQELNVCHETLKRWMAKYNVQWEPRNVSRKKLSGKRYSEKEEKKILGQLHKYDTLSKASQALKVSTETLRIWRQKHNVQWVSKKRRVLTEG